MIEYIIDGDTVILGNGAHLRLIGIDTPEIDHEGGDSETGAEAARRYLVNLLDVGKTYPLIADRETRDHHGRHLGHLFLDDGTNIQARLLEAGFAVPLIIPPNLKFLDCYRRAADHARERRRGLWNLPRYQPVAAADLDPGTRGYRIVTGTVTRTGKSRSSIWVNLGDEFAVRIVREDLSWFAGMDPASLKGDPVRVRGRVYRRSDQLRIRVRHPFDLRVLPNNSRNR